MHMAVHALEHANSIPRTVSILRVMRTSQAHTVFWRTTSIGHTFWVIETIKSFIQDYFQHITHSQGYWVNHVLKQEVILFWMSVLLWVCKGKGWLNASSWWTNGSVGLRKNGFIGHKCFNVQRVNMVSCVCIVVLHSLQTHRWLV